MENKGPVMNSTVQALKEELKVSVLLFHVYHQ